jgi:hypothetical protein
LEVKEMYGTEIGLRDFRLAVVKLTNFLNPSQFVAPVPEQYLGALVGAINAMANQALELYPPHHMSNERSEDTLLWQSIQRIATLTSTEIRGKWFYTGDAETLLEVWDEADRTPKYSKCGRYVYEGDLRSVTFSETWGPVPCEHEVNGVRCGKECFAVYVSRDELSEIPYDTGSRLINYVINGRNSKGQALCDDHAPVLREGASIPI